MKQSQQSRFEVIGARVRAGLMVESARRTGTPGRYLFSTMLKCADCGASFVMVGRTHYRCAPQANGRKHFCRDTLSVKRVVVERVLLADLKERLLSPAVIDAVCKEVPKRVAHLSAPKPVDNARIATLRAEIANLSDAVGSRLLRTSPAIAQRLQAADRSSRVWRRCHWRPPRRSRACCRRSHSSIDNSWIDSRKRHCTTSRVHASNCDP